MEEDESDKDKSPDYTETLVSSDSDNDSLQIAIENGSTPKKKGQSLDKTIEETIEKCENFTPDIAKKMLLKLIRNEHLLALAVLKAEEEEKRARTSKSSESDEDDKKSESDTPTTPKLTRLKAKQLNHILPLPGSLKTPEVCQVVVDLIHEDLKSDDEDDEYQPEDEILSDEDITNTTFSDIESQPSTPGSALFDRDDQDHVESPVKVGEFKVPRPLSMEEQENISKRTRSKLCLSTTPIETIESTFVPPDITTDMYDFDQDHEIDNEWKEFLNEFMMPLTNAEEEDDKNDDPEYVAAEPAPVDKEELRPVRVSKKELNQLISELLEDSSNLNFESDLSTSYKRHPNENQAAKSKRQRIASPVNLKYQPTRISSKMYSQADLLNTPPPRVANSHLVSEPSTPCCKPKEKGNDLTSPGFLDQAYVNPFFHQQLQTPQRLGFTTPTFFQSPAVYPSPGIYNSPAVYQGSSQIMTPVQIPTTPFLPSTPVPPAIQAPTVEFENSKVSQNPESEPAQTTSNFQRLPQITGVYGSVPANLSQSSQPPTILVVNGQNQLEILSSANLMTQAFCSNGIVQLPQYQSVVIQVPTIDLLQNRINLGSFGLQQTVTHEGAESSATDGTLNAQNLTDDSKNQLTNCREKLNVFDYLENLAPPDEQTFDPEAKGFTYEQRAIYEQQMRMHAQLLSQHFLQIFGNPQWWEKSEPIKNDLMELKKAVDHEFSPHTAKHIENCITMCQSWEHELEEDSERNKKYAEFLYNEQEFDMKAFEEKRRFKGRFHPRLIEHILGSKAILYPSLLPTVSFRSVSFSKVEPPTSELMLMSIGLERCHKELYDELNSLNPYRIREPKVGSIVRAVVREYTSFRNFKNASKLVENYKNHKKMNPIKYFFINKKAPPVHHKIEEVDLNNIKPPKRLPRGALNKPWDSYMFSFERLQLHPYCPQEVDSEQTVNSASETTFEDNEAISSQAPSETPQIESSSAVVDNLYCINITYDDVPKINICFVPKSLETTPVSCVSLRSPDRVREKSTKDKQSNLISILKKVSDCLEKTPTKKKSVNFNLPTSAQTRSSSRLQERLNKPTVELSDTFLLAQKFFIIIESFFNNYIKNLKLRNEVHPLLALIFRWAQTIDLYIQLVEKSIMNSKKIAVVCGSTDVATKPKKCVSTSEEYSKKLHRKLTDNRSLIMHSNRNKCMIEKDCSYAYNYLDRVKKTLLEHGDDELFLEFMSTLSSFDSENESIPELYHKIEILFYPNYSELVDLFLTFLLPEHAAEVGRFFEHFILNNMSNLLQKLNFYFNKQPLHMKKIITCLNDLSNEKDITMERLKSKFQPLLKGNQMLIDWFDQLFEKPPGSLAAEYEHVYIKKSLSDSDNSIDSYYEEIIHSKDIVNSENFDELNLCGVRYKNGKITYQGMLLPAKISFLAHDSPSAHSEKTETASLCMHQIRKHVKFNDPKIVEEPQEILDSECKRNSSKNIAKSSKTKLCDAQTLHAHAVRLNSVHAQNGEKISDLTYLLTPPRALDSPKKTRNVKKSGNSPKKNITKSPTSSSGNSASPSNQSPSKAIQTAKKLRNLIDEGSEEPPSKKKKGAEEATSKLLSKEKKKTKAQKSSETTTASKKFEFESKFAENNTTIKQNPRVGATGCWTREEDKLILEEINEDDKEELVDVLLSKLKRPRHEISSRWDFLLDIIKMHKKQ